MNLPAAQPSDVSVQIVIPIYKRAFSDIEQFSIAHSLGQLAGTPHVFIHPDGLDTAWYAERFPAAQFRALPKEFFGSHKAYNQLCYEVEFYRLFSASSHMLILQPDAVVARPDKLLAWCRSDFDYVGGPEEHVYHYDIGGIPPFDQLGPTFAQIRLQGLNGGLSLRRVAKVIDALQEYPALTRFFRQYAGGIGEDIFFSLLGRVTRRGFRVPNELTASDFALTANFKGWHALNAGELPFGFHAWYRQPEDERFVGGLVGYTAPAIA